jgi:4-amino-4-deoxy-L-arabinose transferase-like glycosyltransferase
MRQHRVSEVKSAVARPGPVGPDRLQRYGLVIILGVFIILGLLYDFTVPFFEKPDELKHFAVLQFIQRQGQLPVVQEGVYEPWDQEGTQPPLYHVLAAMGAAWLDLSNFQEPPRNPHYVDERSFVWRERGNNNLYLHAPGESWSTTPVFIAARLARWLSLLAGSGTIILTYYLARIVFVDNAASVSSPMKPGSIAAAASFDTAAPTQDTAAPTQDAAAPQTGKSEDKRLTTNSLFTASSAHTLPLLAAALVAFIPQFLHVSTAITNDSLSVTVAAAALVLLALILKRGASTRYAIYLGFILGLGALAKLSLLYLGPLTGLVLLIDFYRRRSLRRLLKYGLIIGGLALALAGWWYWRNWQLYGDPLALKAHLLYRGGPLDPRPGLAQLWQSEMTGLELSFWAAFGAGQILLEAWLYEILRWVKYLILAGLVIGLWRSTYYQLSIINDQLSSKPQSVYDTLRATRQALRTIQPLHHSSFIILTLLLLWTLTIFVALLRWMQITPASWGRLLYPALPALDVLAAWSLAQFQPAPRPRFESNPARYALRTRHYILRASTCLPWLLLLFLFSLALISPFRYIRAAYARTPLIAEADIPLAEINQLDLFYGPEALHLVGYRIEKEHVRPGEWLPVTLYWQATQPLAKNYSAFAHLLDIQGNVIGQANSYPDGGRWPTSLLPPGKALADTHYILVSPQAKAPQISRLAIGIFEFEEPARAAKPALNRAGERVEPIVEGVPIWPEQWPELKPARPLEATFGRQIKLIGYDPIDEKQVRPGSRIPITFYWETVASPGRNLNLFIHLVEPASQTQAAGFDGPPDYPTRFWQPGQTIIDARTLAFPGDLPPGEYELRIGWYSLDDFARLPLAGEGEAGDAVVLFSLVVE